MSARPKAEGLWVRLTLLDGSEVDGIIPQNLLLFELGEYVSIMLIGQVGSNRKLVAYPRSQVRACVVLGVIGGRGREKFRVSR